MDLLSPESVRMQLAIWGYAVVGDLADTSALVSEGHPELVRGGAWDRTAAQLAGQLVAHGDAPMRRVKDWAALPWAAEHILRGHAEWPGL